MYTTVVCHHFLSSEIYLKKKRNCVDNRPKGGRFRPEPYDQAGCADKILVVSNPTHTVVFPAGFGHEVAKQDALRPSGTGDVSNITRQIPALS